MSKIFEIEKIKTKIFSVKSNKEFNEIALKLFYYQAINNKVYKKYIKYLNINISNIKEIKDIPFLPIEFFKTQKVVCDNTSEQIIFESSGTTGTEKSLHYMADVSVYEESFIKCFKLFYGEPSNYNIIALLPSYLERNGSSLIYMVNKLIELSNNKFSGFFLYNTDELFDLLAKLKKSEKKTILLGVSFALLDFAIKYKPDLSQFIIMETGGMKGRKKEIVREELHELLCSNFNVKHIHSEYGMTELSSQAYSQKDGIFNCPPWMKVFVRNTDDPLSVIVGKGEGALNIIDLANIYSCSFIATQDLCKIKEDNSFSVLGRIDNSEVRGCNLMIL